MLEEQTFKPQLNKSAKYGRYPATGSLFQELSVEDSAEELWLTKISSCTDSCQTAILLNILPLTSEYSIWNSVLWQVSLIFIVEDHWGCIYEEWHEVVEKAWYLEYILGLLSLFLKTHHFFEPLFSY